MKEVELFKLLADPNRLKIFSLLIFYELCVCDLEDYLGLKQANVSKHMAKYKDLNIVNTRKEAQWVYFSLDEQFKNENQELIEYLKEKTLKDQELSHLVCLLKDKKSNCQIRKESK